MAPSIRQPDIICSSFMNDNFYFQQKTWKEIYMNVYFSSTCNKLRNFQLKLLHRCLPRKRISFNANKCEDPLCNFCKNEPDSLIHIYVTCLIIRISQHSQLLISYSELFFQRMSSYHLSSLLLNTIFIVAIGQISPQTLIL